MSWLSKIVVLFLTLALLQHSYAADSVNLLVMVEDADQNSIPRDSRINKRVHASISQQLNHIVDVYDETSLTLTSFKQGRVRRSDAELFDMLAEKLDLSDDVLVEIREDVSKFMEDVV